MYLDRDQMQLLRKKIRQLINYDCLVYPTRVFEIFDVPETKKDKFLATLKKSDLIDSVVALKDKPLPTFPETTYTFRGIIKNNYALDEKIEVHNELNPKLWDSSEELLPEVRAKVMEIAKTFAKQIKQDAIDLNVLDVWLLGSNANYNYTDQSDLDIHLIADKSVDCSKNHLQLLYNAYKTLFNNKYDIKIKGIDAEVYIENPHDISDATTGVYSLKKGWLRAPVLNNIPEINETALAEEVNKWETRYFDLTSISNTDNIDVRLTAIDKFLDDIYKMRIKALQKEGEFALGNLVFKEIRNLGYLDDLKDLKTKLTAQKLSLN